MKKKVYDILKEKFAEIVREHDLGSDEITVTATTLTPEEAIGHPEDKDYPIITGKERLMQAEFRGHRGQAFTDMHGNFSGRLADIVAMNTDNNYRRAIFISSLNAVMSYLGQGDKTVHCRNEEPRTCSVELVQVIAANYANPRIAFVGFQPRMIEVLSKRFELRVTDMDTNNIGTEKFGIFIDSPDKTEENLAWCDMALVTGTTIVNETIDQFMIDKPVIFYGVSISGTAALLGLNKFCHCGH